MNISCKCQYMGSDNKKFKSISFGKRLSKSRFCRIQKKKCKIVGLLVKILFWTDPTLLNNKAWTISNIKHFRKVEIKISFYGHGVYIPWIPGCTGEELEQPIVSSPDHIPIQIPTVNISLYFTIRVAFSLMNTSPKLHRLSFKGNSKPNWFHINSIYNSISIE